MKIKKLLILLIMILAIIILPNVVNAAVGDTFIVDGIKYTVLTENTVEVSGYDTETADVIIPTNVVNDTKNYTVSAIGDSAFLKNSFLKNITIPSSVTTIGTKSFRQCTSLTSIELPNSIVTIGEEAFMFCEALKTINIPSSVTTIGESAFLYCRVLTNITIPNSVTTVGARAFEECDTFTSIEIPSSLTAISDQMFYSCDSLENVTIPNTITSIGSGAFSGCDALKKIDIPNSVKEIGSSAFSYTQIETINIPDGIEKIATGTFYDCSNLKNIKIPYTVTSIEMNSFFKCTSLTELIIPCSVNSIGENAFGYCTSLTIYAQGGSIAEEIAKENNINFEKLYRIIINADEEKVSINQKDSIVDILKGSNIDVEIKSNKGYKLTSILVNGIEKLNELKDDILTIENLKEDTEIIVETEVEKYEFVEGENSTYNNEDLKFKVNGDFELFTKLYVNGVELDKVNYSVESGSTVITLLNEYLKTLDEGTYKLKAEYSNGTFAETTFKIEKISTDLEPEQDEEILEKDEKTENNNIESENNTNPKTGDSISLFLGIFIISVVGIIVTMKLKKQNK